MLNASTEILVMLLVAFGLGFLIAWLMRKERASALQSEVDDRNRQIKKSETEINGLKASLTESEKHLGASQREQSLSHSRIRELETYLDSAKAELSKYKSN